MSLVLQMFDPVNKMTIDVFIEPKSAGERELTAFHFLKLMPISIVLASQLP